MIIKAKVLKKAVKIAKVIKKKVKRSKLMIHIPKIMKHVLRVSHKKVTRKIAIRKIKVMVNKETVQIRRIKATLTKFVKIQNYAHILIKQQQVELKAAKAQKNVDLIKKLRIQINHTSLIIKRSIKVIRIKTITIRKKIKIIETFEKPKVVIQKAQNEILHNKLIIKKNKIQIKTSLTVIKKQREIITRQVKLIRLLIIKKVPITQIIIARQALIKAKQIVHKNVTVVKKDNMSIKKTVEKIKYINIKVKKSVKKIRKHIA